MKIILLLLFLFFPCSLLATIYEQHDERGYILFTDQPDSHAVPTQLDGQGLNRMTITTSASKITPAAQQSRYTQFAIASPGNEQTFQNQRQIAVVIAISPALQNGDRVQLVVDDKIYGQPQTQGNFVLDNLDRGAHTLQVQLVDAQGKAQQSTPKITMYVHYAVISQDANKQ